MRIHDWPMLLKAQTTSGQTIAAFCASRGLTVSKFYAERAKRAASKAVVPIAVESNAIRITLQLRTTVVIAGRAADLAEVLRCL
jgi:hypothetical protein